MEQTVNTLHELIELAEKGVNLEASSLKISPELSDIRIQIEGPGYNEAIPGRQLITLWDLQLDLYRIVAFALNKSFDTRTLSSDDLSRFEVKVTTFKGSWLSNVLTSEFWDSLFHALVGKMSGQEIGVTISACVLITMGYLHYDSVQERLVEFQREKNVEKSYQTIEKVVDLFNSNSCSKARIIVQQTQATINSTVVKTATHTHEAKRIIVAGHVLNDKQIEDIKSRNKLEYIHPELIKGQFFIVELDKSIPYIYSMRLKDSRSGVQISANFSPDGIDGNGEKAKVLINEAFHEDSPVDIEVYLGKEKNFIMSVSKIPVRDVVKNKLAKMDLKYLWF